MAFKQNQAGFKQLAHSKQVGNECLKYANVVASAARASAPVDTGEYAGGISAFIEDHPSRVTAQVVASDPKSLIIESLTGNMARALNRVKRG